jgi:hypothetical protein
MNVIFHLFLYLVFGPHSFFLGPFINFFLFSSSNFEMLFFFFCFDFRFNSFSFNFGFLFWVPLWSVRFFQFHHWIYKCYLLSWFFCLAFSPHYLIYITIFFFVLGSFIKNFSYFLPLTLKCYFSFYFVLVWDLILFILILDSWLDFFCEMFFF